jgi:hypothetical protein
MGIGNDYEAGHADSKNGCVGFYFYFAVAFELRSGTIFGSNHHANAHRAPHNHPHADSVSYADTIPDNHSHADALTNGDPLASAGSISDNVCRGIHYFYCLSAAWALGKSDQQE